jgi:hypothetical protein
MSVAALCAAAAVMPAQAGRNQSVVYELRDDSTYVEGCFGLCLCALFFYGTVEGTMTFTPQVLSGTVDLYDVSDVQWQVNLFDMPGGPIYTGSGTYTIFKEVAPLQQLQLELDTEDLDPIVYDSGLEPIDAKFPQINVQISMGDMTCYDRAFSVVAGPAGTPPPPSADLNADGLVNGLDLALLLGQWGPCPVCIVEPCFCLGDLNGDTVVNGFDLALLLGQWTR